MTSYRLNKTEDFKDVNKEIKKQHSRDAYETLHFQGFDDIKTRRIEEVVNDIKGHNDNIKSKAKKKGTLESVRALTNITDIMIYAIRTNVDIDIINEREEKYKAFEIDQSLEEIQKDIHKLAIKPEVIDIRMFPIEEKIEEYLYEEGIEIG